MIVVGLLVGMTGSVPTAAADTVRGYNPRIRPSDFVRTVDNPYFPLVPGAHWVYETTTPDGTEQNPVEVTHDTKTILGVTCIVVHDVVTVDGQVTEDTYDWYAQDRRGNVWYFGEDTKEYKKGKVTSTEGSWEGGVAGAKPGIIMKAHPRVGATYRQEYARGSAEDMARVLRLHATVTGPSGTYRDVVVTKDYSPLERQIVEHKYYARGSGVIREVTVKGASERVELIRYAAP